MISNELTELDGMDWQNEEILKQRTEATLLERIDKDHQRKIEDVCNARIVLIKAEKELEEAKTAVDVRTKQRQVLKAASELEKAEAEQEKHSELTVKRKKAVAFQRFYQNSSPVTSEHNTSIIARIQTARQAAAFASVKLEEPTSVVAPVPSSSQPKPTRIIRTLTTDQQQLQGDDGDLQRFVHRISEWDASFFTELFEFTNRFSIPEIIWDNLLDYQRDAVKWLSELYQSGHGGVLGDEMGLGKTVQVAAFLASLVTSGFMAKSASTSEQRFSENLPSVAIIVAPLTVLQQWINELNKWAPFLRSCILHSSGSAFKMSRGTLSMVAQRHQLMNSVLRTGGVIVTTYAAVTSQIEDLLKLNPFYVVLDEGHRISNPSASVTLACKAFTTPHRMLLSGSPIQNSLTELWCLYDFAFPGHLGTQRRFISVFDEPITASRRATATTLQQLTALECARTLRHHLAPVFLRRLKRDVNTLLPAKHERIIRCILTDSQLSEYLDVLRAPDVHQLLRKLDVLQFDEGPVDSMGRERWTGKLTLTRLCPKRLPTAMASTVFSLLHELRMVCNHSKLSFKQRKQMGEESIDELLAGSGKLAVLRQLLMRWDRHGHKALVFSQTRLMLNLIEKMVSSLNLSYMRLDGMTGAAGRPQLIDRFNKDASLKIALLTTRVGGVGVNLVGANRVVIFDPDWNPATDAQARERAWRIGQSREVCIYRLVTGGTIEEMVLHRQLAKTYVAQKVLLDPTLAAALSDHDLVSAIRLGQMYADRIPDAFHHLCATGAAAQIALELSEHSFLGPVVDMFGNSVENTHEEQRKNSSIYNKDKTPLQPTMKRERELSEESPRSLNSQTPTRRSQSNQRFLESPIIALGAKRDSADVISLDDRETPNVKPEMSIKQEFDTVELPTAFSETDEHSPNNGLLASLFDTMEETPMEEASDFARRLAKRSAARTLRRALE